MDPAMSKMILADIAKLRKMPELAKRIEEYQPQPDPMMQQKAQLELALLEAQVANESAKAKENEADIALKQAKTRDLHSKSDLNDLDFVTKESGVADANKEEQMKLAHAQTMEQKEFDRLQGLDNRALDSLNI